MKSNVCQNSIIKTKSVIHLGVEGNSLMLKSYLQKCM